MRSFSGAEKALAMCAISLALAAESPVKIVVLDEMGRIDSEYKVPFMATVFRLLEAGTINQAILVDTSKRDYTDIKNENFSIIEL